MVKRYLLYTLVSIVAISIYVPGFTNSLLADDWPVIARNMNLSLRDMLQLFRTTNAGWYRPLFDLFINLCTRCFSLNALGYHLVIIGVYLLVTVLIAEIAGVLTGESSIGILSALLFGIHSVHAEPVLWISASNELLAGLFVLLSLRSYILFRESIAPVLSYCFAGIFYLAGISSKETAVFLPMMFVAYDWWKGASNTRGLNLHTLLPAIPFLLIQIVFIIFRLLTGSPYSISVTSIRIAINLLYYLAVEVFTLPDNYGYLTSLSLWRQQPFLPILAVGITAFSLGILAWLYVRFAKSGFPRHYADALKFTCSWGLVALYPVILTATGRTAFMSSMGVVWSITILLFLTWKGIKAKPAFYKRLWVLALVLLAGVNLGVSYYRSYWWKQAGYTMEKVLSQLSNEIKTIPATTTVCVVGLPDHLRHAYTFRNAFPTINQVVYPNHNIHAILDSELDTSKDYGRCKGGIILWNGESLKRVK